jgi:hypothetical protein
LWGGTGTNLRGVSLLQFLVSSYLNILNLPLWSAIGRRLLT